MESATVTCRYIAAQYCQLHLVKRIPLYQTKILNRDIGIQIECMTMLTTRHGHVQLGYPVEAFVTGIKAHHIKYA